MLPGIGHYEKAVRCLEPFKDRLDELVLNKNVPILGICVGMQVLGNGSEEAGLEGLGYIKGYCKKFRANPHENLLVPHIGWNTVQFRKNSIFSSLSQKRFYFCHSYYFCDGDDNAISGHSFYGKNFVSAVEYKNVFGVQFHPEKSHKSGLILINKFLDIASCYNDE